MELVNDRERAIASHYLDLGAKYGNGTAPAPAQTGAGATPPAATVPTAPQFDFSQVRSHREADALFQRAKAALRQGR